MRAPLAALLAPLAVLLALTACQRKVKREEGPAADELWIAREAFQRGDTRVAEAKTQPLPQSISTGGRIAFDDLRISHVFSPVTGRVTRVLAQLGQRVHKGTPLAAIASPDVGSAFADQAKARADLTAAEHDFRRQKLLFAAQAGSSREYEISEDNYRKAKAEQERSLQRLRLLRTGSIDAVTQEYTLPSQIDGRLVARMVSPGMEVQGQFSGGTALEMFTVGSIDSVWLFADVAESDLPLVEKGAPVTVRVLAYPGKPFSGHVEWVSATLDPVLRTARIRCSLPNPDALLKPEMFATVVIERPAVSKLAVPHPAIVRISGQSFVYVLAGERPDGRKVFKRRHVEIPVHDSAAQRRGRPRTEMSLALDGKGPDLVPIVAGLSEGEKVLVDESRPHAEESGESSLTGAQLRSGLVTTAVAGASTVEDSLTIGGRLTFDDQRVSHVFPPVNGRITRVLAAPGQRVKMNDPLAIIQSPDLGSAFADELKAKADLDAAGHELQRQREMYALHASAQKDLEASEDNFGKAKAEHARALQKTRLLRQAAGDSLTQEYVLRSPMDGEVISRMANPGAEVAGAYSGSGNVQELFTIGSIDDLWLLGDVYEADLPYVKLGAQVTLKLPQYEDRLFRGRVDWISDTLDPVLRTAKVRCVLQNQAGQGAGPRAREAVLRPEMYEVVTISTPVRNSLTVPRDALLRLGDETYVFVAGTADKDGGISFRRRVVVANDQLPGDKVPILAGLDAGERVAAQGSIFLVGN